MTLSAIHNIVNSSLTVAMVVCDIGGIWLCQLFTTFCWIKLKQYRCLWYRGDMTLSAIHNSVKSILTAPRVVCDIGGIWLCQLFTTSLRVRYFMMCCLWYRGDMTLSAIHNQLAEKGWSETVVCDIGGIWLCQLFTTHSVNHIIPHSCLWYRGDMTLSAIHNWLQPQCWWMRVVCDIGGIWLCQLFTTDICPVHPSKRLFVI